MAAKPAFINCRKTVNLDIKQNMMAEVLTKKEAIDEIVKEAKKLNKLELQILLTRLRVVKLVKTKRKPIANYDSKKIKPPTMKQIDRWKHEARTYAHK